MTCSLCISVYSSCTSLLGSSSKVNAASVAIASPLQIIHFTKALQEREFEKRDFLPGGAEFYPHHRAFTTL